MGKAFWSAFVVLSLTICLAIPVMAQSDTARLQGTVTDPQGGAVNGATVTVTSTETARVTTATTNDLGYYTVSALPPGYYRVEVKHKDFKTISRVLELQIAQVGAADFQLQLGAASETITVEAGSPVINTQDSAIGDVGGEPADYGVAAKRSQLHSAGHPRAWCKPRDSHRRQLRHRRQQ